MDDKKFQIEVLERLTAIETTLKQMDYKSVENKTDKLKEEVITLENKVMNNDIRISRIEDNTRWLWRTVVGSIIAMIIGAINIIIK